MSKRSSRHQFNRSVAVAMGICAGVPAGLGLLAPPQAAAQGASVLEEIVVTARMRTESLVDAPVAITLLPGAKLNDYNITKLEDVATLAGGGVVIADSGVSPTMSIRGVSSDSTNAGFDQSVGLVIDGVYYDRSRWVSQGYFDVAQVEIVKGPQSLYFNKSAVAGAVVISTANPTDEFEAEVTAGHEFEAEEWYVQGYASGPLTDTLGARLALSYSDSEGWLKNEAPPAGGEDFGAEEELMGRLTLQWDPTANFSANFKVQAVTQDTDGPATRGQLYNCRGPIPFGTQITGIPTDVSSTIGAYYPTTDDCELNDTISVFPGAPGTEFDIPADGEFDSVLTSLNLSWELGDWTLTSVTGYSDYTLKDNTGYTANQGNISAIQKETNDSISQEFRALTNFDGPWNFLVGVNYQQSDFEFDNANQIILAIPDPRNGRTASQDHTATQDATSKSVFGEVQWEFAQDWRLTAGARYSDEEKEADYDLFFVNQNFAAIFPDPFWLPEGTYIKDNFSEDKVSPQVTLEWEGIENFNVFASYREGFKPGGFSLGAAPSASLSVPDDFLFDSEEVEGFEVGFKGLLADGRVSVEMIVYDYEFTDLQLNVFNPESASFRVGNAGKATTTGVEADVRFQATDNLQLSAFATYNEGEYADFISQCWTLQSAAQGCDLETNTQDLDGAALPRAPEYTFGAGVHFIQPLGDLTFDARSDVFWSDDYQLEPTNSPFLVQDSYWRVDASVGLESAGGRWRAALWGRNLTDEDISSFGATRGFTTDQLATIQRLRSYGAELTYRF